MTSEREQTRLMKMMKCIAKQGIGKSINKFQLMDELGISMNTYDKLVQRFKHQYGHLAEYDIKAKAWTYIGEKNAVQTM